jgi:hypothetical protein
MGDPYFEDADRGMAATAQAGNPGTFLVDILPISMFCAIHPACKRLSHSLLVKYIPAWMPGAGFQRKARIWREAITEMPRAPFAAAKKAFVSLSVLACQYTEMTRYKLHKDTGIAGPSVTASLLEALSCQKDPPADAEEVIRNAMAAAYGAGSETVCDLSPSSNEPSNCTLSILHCRLFRLDRLHTRNGPLPGGPTEGSICA